MIAWKVFSLVTGVACIAVDPITPSFSQGGPPTRPVTGLTVTTAPAQATTFWVKGSYRFVNPLPDSAVTRVLVGAVVQATHRLRSTVTRDSFALARPAAGVTISGSFCVTSKRLAVADTSARVCAPWSYTAPQSPLPPPVIDSVRTDTLVVALRILPRSQTASASVFGGTTTRLQWCPVLTMGDGKRVMPSEYQAIAFCKDLYEAEVPLLERGTSAQVRVVDKRPVVRVAT